MREAVWWLNENAASAGKAARTATKAILAWLLLLTKNKELGMSGSPGTR